MLKNNTQDFIKIIILCQIEKQLSFSLSRKQDVKLKPCQSDVTLVFEMM